MPSQEDLVVKAGFIRAFFDDLRAKAGFADQLFADGHVDEARLLVCCYIESLGNGLDIASGHGARNFVQVLVDHGGEPVLTLILPKLLQTSMPYKNVSPPNKAALEAEFARLQANVALTETDLFGALGAGLTLDAISFLRRELWRARLAAVAYSNIRSVGAHWFGSPDSVSFSKTTHRGIALPEIDFSVLRASLTRIIDHVDALSTRTNKWFGHL